MTFVYGIIINVRPLFERTQEQDCMKYRKEEEEEEEQEGEEEEKKTPQTMFSHEMNMQTQKQAAIIPPTHTKWMMLLESIITK